MLEHDKPTIEDIERKTLSSISKYEDLVYLDRAHISAKDFEIYPEIATFIFEYPYKYNKFPDEDIIKTQFSNFNYTPVKHVKYILNLFRKEITTRRTREILSTANKYLKMDADEAVSYLLKSSKHLLFESSLTNRSVADGETQQFIDSYLTGLEESKKLGISKFVSPWINTMYQWPLGSVGVFWGRQGAGKSFLAMDTSIRVAYNKKKKVICISPELSKRDMNCRFHSVLGRYHKYSFDSSKLIQNLEMENFDDYTSFLNKIAHTDLWVTYETGREKFTTATIESIIDNESPYLVYVDGLTLIKDNTSDKVEGWEHVQNVIMDLKNMAIMKGIVILGVAHSNRVDEVSYDSVGKFADRLIHVAEWPHALVDGRIERRTISQQNANRNDIRYVLITKNRTGITMAKSVEILFDPSIGLIGDLNDKTVEQAKVENTYKHFEELVKTVNDGGKIISELDNILSDR